MKRNRIICPEVAVSEQFLPGKSNLKKLPEKSKFFENLPGKLKFYKIFSGKIETSHKFACKNRNFVDPDPRPLRFQTRLTPLEITIRIRACNVFIFEFCLSTMCANEVKCLEQTCITEACCNKSNGQWSNCTLNDCSLHV